MARINMPESFDDKSKLFKLIMKKHLEDGDSSPLKGVFDMDKLNKDNDDAIGFDDVAKDLEKQAEDATQDRNNIFADVDSEEKRIAQLLKQIHRDNQKELGKWGFDIVG